MSITRFSDPDRMFNKSFHRRNDSGELDVFEAARYFSGHNEPASSYNCATYSQRIMREERQPWKGRVSLDVPMRNPIVQQVEKQIKEKKYKQPSSPGGKLASFLNSLFNQTSSKKKKPKSTTQSMKDDEESPGGRRKRRISISHFRSSSTADTKSFYSSSNSGFRTPPAHAHTTSAKNHKDTKYNIGQTHRISIGRNRDDRFDAIDDGADSDSSSDLFELRNYDIGIYSSGLPVYETTHLDSVKRGAPISNGAL